MSSNTFVITSSLTRRLRWMILLLAAFFLISFIVTVLINQNMLGGLTTVNNTNTLLDLTNRISESLQTTALNTRKLADHRSVNETHYAFKVGLSDAKREAANAYAASRNQPEISTMFLSLGQTLQQYERVADPLFQSQPGRRFHRDLLVAEQFEIDARETLRKIQIELKAKSDQTFQQIYRTRYHPIVVAFVLSMLFFLLVMVLGLKITRRLTASVQGLRDATEAVARGDLDYQAPILAHDEFGKLTFNFNEMVNSLRETRKLLRISVNRMERLQSVTAMFSEVARPEQVTDVVIQQGMEAMDADSGAVALPTEDGRFLELIRTVGLPQSTTESMSRFPVESELPIAKAYRLREPIFIESEVEFRKSFKHYDEIGAPGALATLPLMVHGHAVGALAIRFKKPRKFSREDRELMLALSRQCAQALQRATLFSDAQKAISIRDEFLSIASHELRTPLTPLRLQLQSMLRQIKKGTFRDMPQEKLQKIFEASDDQIHRLSRLIDDLLDVSRIHAGKFTLQKEDVDIARLIEDVLHRHAYELNQSRSSVKVHLEPRLLGKFDRIRIEQVILNLLTNAAKYAPGKPIEIRAIRMGEQLHLSVRDEGPGIDLADQQRIFSRYERVKSANNVSGLGLGLYISRQIVEAHGGEIWVESKVGAGSIFRIVLPLIETKKSYGKEADSTH